MLNKNSTPYTFGFAALVTVVSGSVLGFCASALAKQQETAADVYKKTKILNAFQVVKKGEKVAAQDILAAFETSGWNSKFVVAKACDGNGKLLDLDAGVIKALDPKAEIKKLKVAHDSSPEDEAKARAEAKLPFFALYASEADKAANKPAGFAMPISAFGLYSVCYGFLAIKGDCETVMGITYYKDGETPGLGANINEPVFQDQWPDKKKIVDASGHYVAVKASKDPSAAKGPNNYLSLSGATFTTAGVDEMLKDFTLYYTPVFKNYKGAK
ncbi:MAG: hypothetical protein RL095_1800 [Verrucomicrobiota bacterium]|jgi:Na+-transporting NADH:ubiquinone oxidoreductase subunit C